VERFEQKEAVGGLLGRTIYGKQGGGLITNPTILEENVPVTVHIEDFQYSYRCKHCGHEWTENRIQREKVG
jgi:hypothetical protein